MKKLKILGLGAGILVVGFIVFVLVTAERYDSQKCVAFHSIGGMITIDSRCTETFPNYLRVSLHEWGHELDKKMRNKVFTTTELKNTIDAGGCIGNACKERKGSTKYYNENFAEGVMSYYLFPKNLSTGEFNFFNRVADSSVKITVKGG